MLLLVLERSEFLVIYGQGHYGLFFNMSYIGADVLNKEFFYRLFILSFFNKIPYNKTLINLERLSFTVYGNIKLRP